MKKINFTIGLFAIGFIAAVTFAAFNYSTIYMGDSNSSSMADGINNSGEVFDIEDEKNNFGVTNAEQVIPINNNDSSQTGGASDTSSGMLAVAGTDGEAAYASDDIVSSEQSVTEDSEDSDQTAGNDDTPQPFVWNNGLIAAMGMPTGYRSVGYSGASGGASSNESESELSSNESESESSSNESESELSSNESESESSSNESESESSSNDSTNDFVDLNEFQPSDDSDWELVFATANEIDAGEVIGYNYNEVTLHPNPEPATIFLFGSGLISLGVFGRKKLKRF